jgi:endonuclease/exonuclease/phosphatase family metal-dependent hydrolase
MFRAGAALFVALAVLAGARARRNGTVAGAKRNGTVAGKNGSSSPVSGEARVWTVATYNLRAFFDDWGARKRLVRATLSEMRPHAICLQEVMCNGAGQDAFVARCLGPEYRFFSNASVMHFLRETGSPPSYSWVMAVACRALAETQLLLQRVPVLGMLVARAPRVMERVRHAVHRWTGADILLSYYVLYAPVWGISTVVHPDLEVLCEDHIVLRTEVHAEHYGTAHRLVLRFPGGRTVWLVNMHLDSTTDARVGREIRAAEVAAVLAWLRRCGLDRGAADCVLCVGDHNTLLPQESILGMWRDAGFISAHHSVHGTEPSKTWPTGISNSPFIDRDGEPGCLDYIYVHGADKITLHGAGIAGDTPCHHDATLYASDHIALWAQFSFKSDDDDGDAPLAA